MDPYVTKVRPGGPSVMRTSADSQCLNSQITEERVPCSTLLLAMFFFSPFLLYSSLHTQRFSSPPELLQPWSNHISCAHACYQEQHQAQHQAPMGCAGTSQGTARAAAAPPCPPDPAGPRSPVLPRDPVVTNAADWTPVAPGPGKIIHVLRLGSKVNFIGSFYVGSLK